jgi:threonine aldolase
MAELPIDLRSDTVTKPTPQMLDAMRSSPVGDDVWGDDPTTNALQERCAAMFGKEAACFVPSGTMANQTAIRAQTQPGDEIIIHQESHIVRYEAGGAAALSGCSFATTNGDRGFFTGDDVTALIRDDDDHFGLSKLVCLENTHNRGGGSIWPYEQLCEVCETAHANGLRTHLDGARIWHAIVETDLDAQAWATPFDTVSACFSKGLGCPAGSIVVGDRETIHKVKRFRKQFGGTMRQTGYLTGAANYAIDHHIQRLKIDHQHAKRIAQRLNACTGISCDLTTVDSNLIYFNVDPLIGDGPTFCRQLWDKGVLSEALDPQSVRFVTHLGITSEQIDRALDIVSSLCS